MEYRNPTPTVDVIIYKENSIVLIERRNEPCGWALPGGFVDEWEQLEHAAIREAKEETGLDVILEELLYVYSNPKRDPRQHNLSVVYTAKAQGIPQGDDDALQAHYFDLNNLPQPIVFDHAEIIQDFRNFQTSGQHPKPSQKYHSKME